MRKAVLVGLFLGAFGCGSADDDPDEVLVTSEAEIRTNTDPNRLVVYSNNIENMIFDWKDLVHAMAEHELRPDLFLVQQVTDQSEMDRLVAFMERRLGVLYRGVVAQNHPNDRRFQDQVQPKPTVTTGIVFRSRRFELAGRDSW